MLENHYNNNTDTHHSNDNTFMNLEVQMEELKIAR